MYEEIVMIIEMYATDQVQSVSKRLRPPPPPPPPYTHSYPKFNFYWY